MFPRRFQVAALVALVSLGCVGSRPKPTGAGSTAILRLMRDWRGVWTGQVHNSPMGAFPYTVFVEEAIEHIFVTSAPMSEQGLDTIRHVYRLVHFDHGTPVIELELSQRAQRQNGSLAYRENLSTDDEAVFCPQDLGCEKVMLRAVRVANQAVRMKVIVNEANHAEIELAFSRREIPGDRDADMPVRPMIHAPRKSARPTKPSRHLDEQGHPLDEDIVLPEHLDKDAGEANRPSAEN